MLWINWRSDLASYLCRNLATHYWHLLEVLQNWLIWGTATARLRSAPSLDGGEEHCLAANEDDPIPSPIVVESDTFIRHSFFLSSSFSLLKSMCLFMVGDSCLLCNATRRLFRSSFFYARFCLRSTSLLNLTRCIIIHFHAKLFFSLFILTCSCSFFFSVSCWYSTNLVLLLDSCS